MTDSLFSQIKRSYSKFSSFAIWDNNNIGDTEIISANIKSLQTHFIFIGLNASASVKSFGNFHHVHRGGRDIWLADSLGKSQLFKGAYMTDVIKNDKSSRQNDVNMRSSNISKNINLLRKELELVATQHSVLIAFGKKAYTLLMENKFKAELLPHYASRQFQRKTQFLKEVQNLQKRIVR